MNYCLHRETWTPEGVEWEAWHADTLIHGERVLHAARTARGGMTRWILHTTPAETLHAHYSFEACPRAWLPLDAGDPQERGRTTYYTRRVA